MRGVAQVQSFVQKVLDEVGSSITRGESMLVGEIVRGISEKKSVLLSEIARATTDGSHEELLRQERRLSRELKKEGSGLDALPDAYLAVVNPLASTLPFVTVDGSDLSKLYGGTFEHLCFVRDGSTPGKPTRPGYWTVNIEATDGHRQHLPLLLNIYSTEDPAYLALGEDAWSKTFMRAVEKVVSVRGLYGTWLFDRGFDDVDWMRFLFSLDLSFVVRLKKNRVVEVGDQREPLALTVGRLAWGLAKPYAVDVPYVDTSTHTVRSYKKAYGYVPVRVPGVETRMWLIIVKARKKDWYLLCNEETMNAKRAGEIVLTYVLRWGSEEVTRCFKQCTGAENFRVRSLVAIRRLLFLAMLALAVQALLLFLNPTVAKQVMAKVQAFFRHVLFPHYRLWDGMALVLKEAT
jgi:Transposase DDE domain